MTVYDDGGRSAVLSALRSELFGPPSATEAEPQGKPIELSPPPVFALHSEANGPFHEAVTGNEILLRDRPTKRYGVGVLYPQQQRLIDANEGDVGDAANSANSDLAPSAETSTLEPFVETTRGDTQDEDFDLTATGQYRPSAMAVSFLADFSPRDLIEVSVSGARYELVHVEIAGRQQEWYVRRPFEFVTMFAAPSKAGKLVPLEMPDTAPLILITELLARQRTDGWLCTVALVNKAPEGRSAETMSLFQAAFTVTITRDGDRLSAISPYPDPHSARLLDRDPEARSLDLMYRNAPTFGVGHGCAATWDEQWGVLHCQAIHATALPSFESPSITPDIALPDGTSLAVPMGPLAGLDSGDDGFDSIRRVAEAYDDWITGLVVEADELNGHRHQAAQDHIERCRRAHRRITAGIEWLSTDRVARRAFVLANRALLEQQLHFRNEQRATRLTRDGLVVEPGTPTKDWRTAKRSWRAFQIGFIVATAHSAVIGDHEDRETVELIFFPTGGGKTEAYLGLSAFCLFYQRLTGRVTGVSVLMRYTLRLLTSQQFLRASALVCAMEIIREDNEDLGTERFTIGIWVGATTTPNSQDEATKKLKGLTKGNSENPFLVLRCPWCAAQMGIIEADNNVPRNQPRIAGYRQSGGSVEFRCPDRQCPFRRGLPVFVVDEDLYEHRPSIVIGTVDKFAQLAFRVEARALFGLDSNGARVCDPPNLIIQDELHLISGPLGSMVGLYEPIIEHLCSSDEDGATIRPKIIGSTATIRNYAEQIRGLYGRKDPALFPPHGLDASDAFFARHARDSSTGKLVQGRLYVGVHAPGLGSIQTAQVRTGSALLQAAIDLPEEQRDPWWTSLMFFNSLRELGTSISLLQSDIRDYLYTMKLRRGSTLQRFINTHMELTSRLRQDEIPGAIARLERPAASGRAVDVCLASNIIEVGVDIPRLSMLTVLGQPKSTSQYIQITGRVGRNWQERPGLVVTIYSALRPRDRSHFEKFQTYHQRLYAEVEPVSVTPFSTPVLRRAAHAAAIAHIRQNGPAKLTPSPMPADLFDEALRILTARAEIADPDTVVDVKREMERRRLQWTGWEPAVWEARTDSDNGPLLRRAGEWVSDDLIDVTWSTPTSMRDVDAECRCAVTTRYAVARGESESEENLR